MQKKVFLHLQKLVLVQFNTPLVLLFGHYGLIAEKAAKDEIKKSVWVIIQHLIRDC